jgi:hypothetical protein
LCGTARSATPAIELQPYREATPARRYGTAATWRRSWRTHSRRRWSSSSGGSKGETAGEDWPHLGVQPGQSLRCADRDHSQALLTSLTFGKPLSLDRLLQEWKQVPDEACLRCMCWHTGTALGLRSYARARRTAESFPGAPPPKHLVMADGGGLHLFMHRLQRIWDRATNYGRVVGY